MAKTVGDFFVERLHQWGVRRIYGYPGDGINGGFGALQRAEGKIEFVPWSKTALPDRVGQVRSGLTAGGRWIRTSGSGERG